MPHRPYVIDRMISAKAIAARGGVGIADAVRAALIDMQSQQNERRPEQQQEGIPQ